MGICGSKKPLVAADIEISVEGVTCCVSSCYNLERRERKHINKVVKAHVQTCTECKGVVMLHSKKVVTL